MLYGAKQTLKRKRERRDVFFPLSIVKDERSGKGGDVFLRFFLPLNVVWDVNKVPETEQVEKKDRFVDIP